MLTIPELLLARAADSAQRIFCSFNGREVRFARLLEGVQQMAGVLAAAGVVRGARVGFMLPPSVEHVQLYLAASWLGASAVPFSIHLKAAGLELQLRGSRPQVLVASRAYADALGAALGAIDARPLVVWFEDGLDARMETSLDALLRMSRSIDVPAPRSLDDTVTIAYTSGTTGAPKGVVMSERWFSIGAKNAALLSDAQPQDTYFMWEPFYHIASWMTVLMALQKGLRICMVERFSASRLWEQVAEGRATKLHYLGGLINMILAQPVRDAEKNNGISIAWGAACPAASWRAFEQRFEVTVREGYGISEAQNFTHLNLAGVVGSIGRPVEEFECRIADEHGREVGPGVVGELVLKPKVDGVVMSGYFGEPEKTRAVLRDDGCVYTGDMAMRDERGDFYFKGRTKDALRRRGENVSAWEVERVLNQAPGVEECAVVGVDSALGEQDILAVIKLRDGTRPAARQIISYCATRLAHYQVPRYLQFVDEFPRGPTQRIRKSELKLDLQRAWDNEMAKSKMFEHQPEDLLGETRDGILILTINRPASYNAWTSALRDELARRLIAAEADRAVRGVVLTGAGERAFCSGQDLAELEEFASGASIEQWMRRLTVCYDAVRAFSKPLVAAVNGVAAGSGFQVTQFCDYVVAHAEARLGQTEVSSGLPSVFGTWLMWERVGRRAIELALQGRLMDASEARQLGFVQEIAEPARVLEAALAAAARLAQQPAVAYRLSKAANRAFDQERYAGALEMALAFYREAFDTGAPQAEIGRFFELRAQRRGVVAAQ